MQKISKCCYNNTNRHKSTYLNVLVSPLGIAFIEPPVAIVSPDIQSVVKGRAQTLRCIVSGIPKPQISWMRINNDGKKKIPLSVEKYLGGTVDCPSLTIVDFSKNDEGTYTCIATNEAGEALSNSSYLTYIGKQYLFSGKT